MAFQLIRVAFIVGALGLAAAIATPRGRLPLALRGVYRILRKDRGEGMSDPALGPVPLRKRLLALVLVLAAVLLALV